MGIGCFAIVISFGGNFYAHKAKVSLALTGGHAIVGAVTLLGRAVGKLAGTSSVRAQEVSPQRVRNWQALAPTDEAAEPANTHERTVRQSKNRRYNSTRSDQLLTEQPLGVTYGRIDESSRPSAMPISQSDAVILCTVVGAQPYLTDDKKSIYTEFTVRVEEAFKNELPSSTNTSNLMVLDQEGGALRLKDGRILRYLVGGISRLPNLNGRYVFFVSLLHNGQDVSILTGYELRNGSVISLEDGGDKSPYANLDDATFLDVVRNAVTPGQLSLSEIKGRRR
jgi:hypothetical protein